MKYHKIRNTPLTVCTAEQKIAYKLAINWHDIIKKHYDDVPYAFQKSEVLHLFISIMIKDYISIMNKDYKDSCNYKPGRYDIDTIFYALNAGLEKYINSEYSILSSHEEIGKMFPLVIAKIP